MTKLTRALRATAIHEAGHGVVAYLGNIRWRHITIEPDHDRGSLGHVLEAPLKNVDPYVDDSWRNRRIIEPRIMATAAGHIAEAAFTKRNNYVGSSSDQQSTFDLASVFTQDIRELKAYVKWLRVRTENMVAAKHHWLAIQYLANELLRHRTLGYKAGVAVIQEAYGWLPEPLTEVVDGDGTKKFIRQAQPPLDLTLLLGDGAQSGRRP